MKTTELIDHINNGGLDGCFRDLYMDEERIRRQKNRYTEMLQTLEEEAPGLSIHLFSAPGRSEIGGNHTDHNQGEVLAAAINADIIAAAGKADNGSILIISKGYRPIRLNAGRLERIDREKGNSSALIRGVLAKLKAEGYRVGGFTACLTSDVISGSGISSSAAFETVIGTIISGLYNDMKIPLETIAIAGQYAENNYFGKPCGLMDQMACSVGSLCHIDFAVPGKPVVERIEADLSKLGYSLCITDTGGSHAKLTPLYASIPEEMKNIASFFGKPVLREVSEFEVADNIPKLRELFGDRAVLRALHFYEENKRVRREADALKKGDMESFLKAFRESARSSFEYLQNVYPPTEVKSQNTALALMAGELVLRGHGGVRIHGGGFAGTVQAFVPAYTALEYRAEMNRIFGENACSIFLVRNCGGTMII